MKFDIDDMPRDPEAAFIQILEFFDDNASAFFSTRGVRKEFADDLEINIRFMIAMYFKSSRFGLADSLVKELESTVQTMNVNSFRRFIKDVKYRVRLEEIQEEAEQENREEFFELGPDQKSEVQKKVNELRETVQKSGILDEEHKIRLLRRIALIEREIYKTRGRIDTVLAGIVDFGTAFGKFGEEAKPFVERMTELLSAIKGKEGRVVEKEIERGLLQGQIE